MNVTDFVERVEWLRLFYRELGVPGGPDLCSRRTPSEMPLRNGVTSPGGEQPGTERTVVA